MHLPIAPATLAESATLSTQRRRWSASALPQPNNGRFEHLDDLGGIQYHHDSSNNQRTAKKEFVRPIRKIPFLVSGTRPPIEELQNDAASNWNRFITEKNG